MSTPKAYTKIKSPPTTGGRWLKLQRIRRHRARVIPALRGVAAEREQPAGLLGGLDALGRDAQVERVRQADDRGHDLLVDRVGTLRRAQPGHERAGQLEAVDRQVAQI